MTPAERYELITRPFPRVRYHSSSYPWAGVLISEPMPSPEKVLKGAGDWNAADYFGYTAAERRANLG